MRAAWFRADVELHALATIELESVVAARRGARGFRGHWLVDVVGEPPFRVGTTPSPWDPTRALSPSDAPADDARLVRLEFQGPVRARCFVFPLRVRSLRVGVPDAADFVAAIERRRRALLGQHAPSG
jgi:hypothetical protein